MKHTDIRPCLCCGKGVMHTGLPLFYHVTVSRMGVDARAVQRQHGLEQMLGNHVLAHHMGSNEDIARPLVGPLTAMICETCAMEGLPLAALFQRAVDAAETPPRRIASGVAVIDK